MKHIYLDKIFLLFLLIIILTGNFNSFFPYFLILLIHEMGHAITGILLGYKLDKITLYPYGGVTSFNLPLNIPLKKELFILIMGPIMQVVGYFLLKGIFKDISLYHYTLLIFNLLPIYPLDGGRILNILCGYVFNYLRSFYITFTISILFLIMLFIYNLYHFNLNMLLMIMVMIKKLQDTYQKRYFYYNRFLLERYLYHFYFKKTKNIFNIKSFYRDRKHLVNDQNEEKILKSYFNKNI